MCLEYMNWLLVLQIFLTQFELIFLCISLISFKFSWINQEILSITLTIKVLLEITNYHIIICCYFLTFIGDNRKNCVQFCIENLRWSRLKGNFTVHPLSSAVKKDLCHVILIIQFLRVTQTCAGVDEISFELIWFHQWKVNLCSVCFYYFFFSIRILIFNGFRIAQ